ncbi:MAG: hypothetical protein ACD_23C00085G0002, partial [uncultured bacterium]
CAPYRSTMIKKRTAVRYISGLTYIRYEFFMAMECSLPKEMIMGSKAIVSGITPLHIEIALHYFKSQGADASAYTGRDGDAVALICHEFAEAGLLEMTSDQKHWKATDTMRRYVESVCSVPLPKNARIQPDMVSHLDTILNGRNSRIGDDTIQTRNTKITNVMNEYVTAAPLARF